MKKFTFNDENTNRIWIFDIISGNEDLSEEELDNMIDNLIDDSHNYNGEDLENTYGVHDVSFDVSNILGFTSYEVKSNKFPELMEKWRNIFKQRGYETSTVYYK